MRFIISSIAGLIKRWYHFPETTTNFPILDTWCSRCQYPLLPRGLLQGKVLVTGVCTWTDCEMCWLLLGVKVIMPSKGIVWFFFTIFGVVATCSVTGKLWLVFQICRADLGSQTIISLNFWDYIEMCQGLGLSRSGRCWFLLGVMFNTKYQCLLNYHKIKLLPV